ncbi:MAG: hypothetical protein LBU36_08075 [Clostridiales bacterium]|jgi:hypothetical protein|nr:hypothetical protein [Clostridiales bacterium]
MKKFTAIALTLVMLFSLCTLAQAATVTPRRTTLKALVNGAEKSFEGYNIAEYNYFLLRDLTYALSGTKKQFDVAWSGAANSILLTSGKPYTVTGGETERITSEKTPYAARAASKILLDGKNVNFEAYNINGRNYFKLIDIGKAFDFSVEWNGNTVVIDTGKPYTAPPANAQSVNPASQMSAEEVIPYMSKEGIDKAVAAYNKRNPGVNLSPSNYYDMPKLWSNPEEADKRGISVIENSGTWGQTMEQVLPYMTKARIDKAVAIYNQKHPQDKRKNAADLYIAF